MKATFQTRFGEAGNCLAACIASILEVPIDLVDFTGTPNDWLDKCQKVLKPLGFFYLGLTRTEGVPMNMMVIPDTFCIFVGPTKTTKESGLFHCVVGCVRFKGEMHDKDHPLVHFTTIFDPLLGGDGLVDGLPTEIGFLV